MERRRALRDIIKMIIVLTIISTVMGTTLSIVESVTREPIAYSRLKFVKGPAVLAVLGNCENDPIKDYQKDVVMEEKPGLKVTKSIFPAKKNGRAFAIAFEVTGHGYGGGIGIMVGIDLRTGRLTGMRVITHSETPGLGARSVQPEFYNQFNNLGILEAALTSKGGKIDAISGATITSTGVADAVKEALDLFARNKERIMSSVGAG
jgi:electron transport complex protein RnfG